MVAKQKKDGTGHSGQPNIKTLDSGAKNFMKTLGWGKKWLPGSGRRRSQNWLFGNGKGSVAVLVGESVNSSSHGTQDWLGEWGKDILRVPGRGGVGFGKL